MLDINLIRNNLKLVKENLKKRKDSEKLAWLDDLLKLDEKWRKIKGEVDSLRSERNKLSQEVNSLMKSGKKKEAQAIIQKAQEVPVKIQKKEEEMDKVREKMDPILMRLPNILHESVPFGKSDKDNEVLRKFGNAKKNPKLLPHAEFAENLGGANFERSAKVAGHGFYYLQGDLARLNQALLQFSIDYMVKQGFEYTETPLLMRKEFVEGVTDLEAFKNVIYKVENEDQYLISTSEHPLMAQFAKENLQRKLLPITQTSYSMCFRKEVGTRSVDEKGLFRTHQFNKVEMIVVCQPKDSWGWHEKMIGFSEEIFKALELPFRVVSVCTGDIGVIAAKKYDIEAWFPRQGEYKEVVSCSNCTDYQARRLGIKYESEKGGYEFVHTLNNTALATSRALVAILENCQNSDGSLTIPKVLRSYLGKDRIQPKNS